MFEPVLVVIKHFVKSRNAKWLTDFAAFWKLLAIPSLYDVPSSPMETVAEDRKTPNLNWVDKRLSSCFN